MKINFREKSLKNFAYLRQFITYCTEDTQLSLFFITPSPQGKGVIRHSQSFWVEKEKEWKAGAEASREP